VLYILGIVGDAIQMTVYV